MEKRKYPTEENGFGIEKVEEELGLLSRYLDIIDTHIRCGALPYMETGR